MSGQSIAERLADVKHRIEQAAARAGREPSSVRLVAVSKGKPAELIREAHAAGQRHFGENYVQELLEKGASLGDLGGITWHAIGRLQRNKVKQLVRFATIIHAIDRVELADELDRRATQGDVHVEALVEVNVSGELTKGGCAPGDVAPILERLARSTHVRPVGLMTVPPDSEDPESARPFFAALRALRDRSGGEAALPHLSMGMTHDFEIAIAEGATIVRVGTAIFGPRMAPASA